MIGDIIATLGASIKVAEAAESYCGIISSMHGIIGTLDTKESALISAFQRGRSSWLLEGSEREH